MEILIPLIALAIFIGLLVWTASLAKKNGRSVPLWLVLGFLFNPIALIILAIMGPAKS